MAAQRKHEDLTAGNAEPADAGVPLDGGILRKALGEAHAAASMRGGESRFDARGLREHAEAALSGNAAEAAAFAGEAAAAGGATWPLRRQFVFIAFASALCWAIVLAPLALVF